MADGTTKPIEQVKIGDLVQTRNPDTKKTETKKVVWTKIRYATELIAFSFADQSGKRVDHITCTPEHPFYVEGKGFIAAGKLAIGNSIVTRAGPSVIVHEIKRSKPTKVTPVYNFEVQDDHSYFVGVANGGEWVHNYPPGVTAIGRMNDLLKYADDPNLDTWWKSGRIPAEGDPPVSLQEDLDWVQQRIDRGDQFKLATPFDNMSSTYGGWGKPNGYFTYNEVEHLYGQGVGWDEDF